MFPMDDWFTGWVGWGLMVLVTGAFLCVSRLHLFIYLGIFVQPFLANLGSIQIKFGIVDAPQTYSLIDFNEVERSIPSLISAPSVHLCPSPNAFHGNLLILLVEQMKGIGTLRSRQTGPEFEDDGKIGFDEGEEGEGKGEEDEEDDDLISLEWIYILFHPPQRSYNQSPCDLPQYLHQTSHSLPQYQYHCLPPKLPPSPTTTSKPSSSGLAGTYKILHRPTPLGASSADTNNAWRRCCGGLEKTWLHADGVGVAGMNV